MVRYIRMCINNVDNKDNGLRKKMWSLDAKKMSVNQFWSKSLWQTAVFLLSNIYSKAYFVMPPVLVCKHSGEDHRFCCHRQGNSLHLNQKKKNSLRRTCWKGIHPMRGWLMYFSPHQTCCYLCLFGAGERNSPFTVIKPRRKG